MSQPPRLEGAREDATQHVIRDCQALTLEARIVTLAILCPAACIVAEVDGAGVEVDAEQTDTALIVWAATISSVSTAVLEVSLEEAMPSPSKRGSRPPPRERHDAGPPATGSPAARMAAGAGRGRAGSGSTWNGQGPLSANACVKAGVQVEFTICKLILQRLHDLA